MGKCHTAGLCHGLGEQSIGFIGPFVRREIIGALEIDRVNFLNRDEFAKIDAAIRFGFERFELGVFDPYYWPLMTS